ncbi:MAG TPA: ABC transporter ATP-binding protein [Longilinea sp.]|nr:ABC transporter ATP-binding protein [Longilinea sp.]
MTNIAIQTDSLSRSFGDVKAVDGISMTVDSGAIFGFLGPNGSGKTTTIRLLLGLLAPDSGSAKVLHFDTRTEADAIRLQTGALLEHTGLYERLSAIDNLEFYGRVWRLNKVERAARIQELLQSMGLWDRRGDTVSTWSRGMKQKLAIARALLHKPALLFLDEPTAGLDPVAAAELHENLINLARKQNVTVFLTTHNLAEAEKLCDQVAVIRHGRILSIGTPDTLRLKQGGSRIEVIGKGFNEALLSQLRQRSEVHSLELKEHHLTISLNGQPETAPLVSLIAAAGVEIEEVRKGAASLEEVFLTLMEEEKSNDQ